MLPNAWRRDGTLHGLDGQLAVCVGCHSGDSGRQPTRRWSSTAKAIEVKDFEIQSALGSSLQDQEGLSAMVLQCSAPTTYIETKGISTPAGREKRCHAKDPVGGRIGVLAVLPTSDAPT